jgi:magnesium-transporting ATPase (P-type)
VCILTRRHKLSFKIGRRSLHLKNSETSVVLGYSIVCVIVILLVELPFYVLISSRFRSEAAIWSLAIVIGWYFIYTSICLLNSFAFFSITRIKRSQSVNPIEVPDASAMSNFLRRIQLASGQLVIVSPVIMGLTTCFLYRSRRGFYSDPRCYWDSLDVAFRLTMWFVEYTCALALWFIAPTARSAMRSLVSQPAPNSISRLSSSLRPRFLGATTITLPTPIRSSEEASAVDKQDSHLLANKPEQATAILGQT